MGQGCRHRQAPQPHLPGRPEKRVEEQPERRHQREIILPHANDSGCAICAASACSSQGRVSALFFRRFLLAFLQIRQRLTRPVDIRRHHFFCCLRTAAGSCCKPLEPVKQHQPFLHDPPLMIENARTNPAASAMMNRLQKCEIQQPNCCQPPAPGNVFFCWLSRKPPPAG